MFATLASQTVLAEKLEVFKKARRDASSPVFNKTTRRVGRMLFLMENAHCATAGDTEQNGAKHFTVARRAIVTCFRRVTDASHSPLTNATVSLSNMPGTTSGTAVQIVRGLG